MSQEVINDVYKKIAREKAIIQGAKDVRASSSNVSVQQKCDSNIREAQNNITYLEGKLRQLRARQQQSGSATGNGSGLGISGGPGINSIANRHQHNASNTSTLSNTSAKSSSDSSSDHTRGALSEGTDYDEKNDLAPPRALTGKGELLI
ncbi:protein kinase C [Sugiyamaella lignohabitans]|uniref:Protein kinase C n=1 Tax=Sugiyamaella lignohabitans TaxID=796027 RepID=A0A167D876_9ASCO|nr:protein kinase C [Sugiyamaella lignohabitans]ANB12600.1 protein kinase C [Sugiyamaella lignohabitans]